MRVYAPIMALVACTSASWAEIDRVLNAEHAFQVLGLDHRSVVDRHIVVSAFRAVSVHMHPDRNCKRSAAECEAAHHTQLAAHEARDILLDFTLRSRLQARLNSTDHTREQQRVGMLFVATIFAPLCTAFLCWLVQSVLTGVTICARFYKWLLPSALSALPALTNPVSWPWSMVHSP